jgi:magnesium chelatase family protein
VTKYQKRISGSMLDRIPPHVLGEIGIHIEVPRVNNEKLNTDGLGESSVSIWERIQATKKRQRVLIEGTDIVPLTQGTGIISIPI